MRCFYGVLLINGGLIFVACAGAPPVIILRVDVSLAALLLLLRNRSPG
jgi:hypothetical protein